MTINNFPYDTISVYKTNAGDTVYFDTAYQPGMTANDALNLAQYLPFTMETHVISESAVTYIFNKRG